MTWFSLTLILLVPITTVIGQLLLKKGMEATNRDDADRGRLGIYLGSGILSLTVAFFLSLGLLQHFDLSYIYPFQGLSVILTALTAAVTLREKLTFPLIVGALLITAGIVLVSLS